MEVYAVSTNGGQIERDQTPEFITVPEFLTPIIKESFNKYGFCADEYANYYPTESAAKRAIDWALNN